MLIISLSNVLAWTAGDPEAFASGIAEVVNSLPHCRTVLISSEAAKADGFATAGVKPSELQTRALSVLRQKCSVDDSVTPSQGRSQVRFENPDGSFWRSRSLQRVGKYQVEALGAVISMDHGCGEAVHNHCSATSLYKSSHLTASHRRLLWSKARYELQRSSVVDEIGCKLVETDLDWFLGRTAYGLSCGGVDMWTTSPIGVYRQPKPGGGERDMQLTGILGAFSALCLLSSPRNHSADTPYECSFANTFRLEENSEFLYGYFLEDHQRFTKAIAWAVRGDRHYRTLDIADFYPSIGQARLVSLLVDPLNVTSPCTRLKERWRAIISSGDATSGEAGRGLPIGHPASGHLSNFFLRSLDEAASSFARTIDAWYFRYVDDMCLIAPTDEALSTLFTHISSNLKSLGLNLNGGKDTSGTADEYFARNADPDLHALGERVRLVVRRVYGLRLRWFQWTPVSESFCQWYMSRLGDIGIRVGVRHLRRRLNSRRFADYKLRLNWSSAGSPGGIPEGDWTQRFTRDNADWCIERDATADACYKMAASSLDALANLGKSSKHERIILTRRLRFATFRLVVLRHPNAPSFLRDLLVNDSPVSPSIIALGLRSYGELASLRDGLDSNSLLTRLCSIDQLGVARDTDCAEQLLSLTRENDQIVRLCATQALLRIDQFSAIAWMRLVEVAKNETDVYVLRNWIVLLARAGAQKGEDWESVVHEIGRRAMHSACLDALAWVESDRGLTNVLHTPDAEPPFYGKSYPDVELPPELNYLSCEVDI
jgi:hypothetical protein